MCSPRNRYFVRDPYAIFTSRLNSRTYSYQFRQASDFWYLTGFEEPNAAVILGALTVLLSSKDVFSNLIIEKTSSSRGYRMTLFSTGSTPQSEQWDGARTPVREASILFNSDESLPISSFSSHLKSTIAHHTKASRARDGGQVFIDTPAITFSRTRDRSFLKHLSSSLYLEKANAKSDVAKLYEGAGLNSGNVKPLSPHVAKLRAIKSPVEQRVMRMAADISGRAHAKVCDTHN